MVGGSGFNLLCGLMNMMAKNSPTTIVPATNIPDRRFKNPPGLFMLREREGCSSIISGSVIVLYFSKSIPFILK